MTRRLLALCIIVSAMAASRGQAVQPSSRGSVLGGGYSALANGADGVWWNPAVLKPTIFFSAGLGLTLEGGNNILTLNQLKGIVQNDAEAKKDAVESIDGRDWNARVEFAGGAAVSIWRFGLGVTPRALVEAREISPELMQYALLGGFTLAPNTTYSIHGSFDRAVYVEYSLGYAQEIPIPVPGLSVSGGVAVKYLQGSDFELFSMSQVFSTGSIAPPLSSQKHQKADKGTGYAVDLGLRASLLAGILKTAVVVRDLGAQMSWTGTDVSSSFDAGAGGFVTDSRTGDFTQKLPTTVIVGASATLPGLGTTAAAALDVRTRPSESRFKVGLEQPIMLIATLRAGYVTAAGPEPGMITFGVGIGALIARFDLAAGISSGNKGGMLAASANISL